MTNQRSSSRRRASEGGREGEGAGVKEMKRVWLWRRALQELSATHGGEANIVELLPFG